MEGKEPITIFIDTIIDENHTEGEEKGQKPGDSAHVFSDSDE